MLRDFLDRFRPAGTPGPAGAVGIPADRWADAQEELAPLFSALADVERRCTAIRETAKRTATRQAAQSQRMAATIVTRARSQAVSERAGAAVGGQASAQAEQQAMNAEADKAVAQMRAAALQRMPLLVDQILDRAGQLAESVTADRP
jgi:hypothetical protein